MKGLNKSISFNENLDIIIEELLEREEFDCTGYLGVVPPSCVVM